MPEEDLVLELDKRLIAVAEQMARDQGISISKLVENYLRDVMNKHDEEQQKSTTSA